MKTEIVSHCRDVLGCLAFTQTIRLEITRKINITLTLSLPEYLMEFCKVTLTFESADEILWWCDHSNETSLPVLIYTWCYLFFKISQTEIWKFGRNLLLAKFGGERVKQLNFTFWEKDPLRGNQLKRTRRVENLQICKFATTWKKKKTESFASRTNALLVGIVISIGEVSESIAIF